MSRAWLLVAAMSLTGCATWDGLTAEQKGFYSALGMAMTGYYVPFEDIGDER